MGALAVKEEKEPVFTGNAEERLNQWAAHHQAETAEAAQDQREDERARRGMGGRNMRALEARNKRRDRLAASTRAELARDVAAAKKGGVTDQELKELMERKELEQKIELEHGLELTDEGSQQYGTSQWKAHELQQIQTALGDIPAEHLTKLDKINRSAHGRSKTTGGLYDSANGVMQMFDAIAYAPGTNTGKTDGITGREGPKRYGANNVATSVGDIFQHEVGHAVAESHQDAYQRFIAAAGWKRIAADKLPAGAREELTAKRAAEGKEHDHDHGHSHEGPENDGKATIDGKRYSLDRYSKHYLERHEGAMPEGQGWAYAGASPEEHFAEVYAKALQVPETLHAELIAQPQAHFEAAHKEFIQAQQALIGAMSSGDWDLVAPNQKRLNEVQQRMIQTSIEVTSRKQQWEIMRKDVFGVTNDEVERRARVLKSQGADAGRLDLFRQQAGKAMTPKQLDRLSAKYAP